MGVNSISTPKLSNNDTSFAYPIQNNRNSLNKLNDNDNAYNFFPILLKLRINETEIHPLRESSEWVFIQL